MKANDYSGFRKIVAFADADNPIWYAGWLWLSLNNRQCKDIKTVLKYNPCIVEENNVLRMPSGLTLKL